MTTSSPDLLHHLQDARQRSGRILLRGAAVVPVDPAVPGFVGDVLIAGNRIEDLGPSLGPVGEDVLEVDLTGRILIPGLVDSHVHAWEGQLRGVAPQADFGTYMGLVHGELGPRYTPADIAVGERLTAAHALNGGVTTIVDNNHNIRSRAHAEAALDALRVSGVRAVAALSAPTAGDHYAQLPQDLTGLRDEFAGDSDGLVTLRLFDVLFDVQASLAGWRWAVEHGFGVSAELGMWVPDIPALMSSGLLGPAFTFNHCAGLDEATWRVIAGSGAAVNLAPRSDVQYGLGGFSPVLETQRHGVLAGISSDNETAYGLDLFAEMRTLLAVQNGLAWTEQFAGRQPPERYAAADVLRAATAGGALNADLGGTIGTIAVGAKADLTIIATDRPTTSLHGDPVSTVVQFAGIGDVESVFVDGAVRKWDGELVDVDYRGLVEEGELSRARLTQRA